MRSKLKQIGIRIKFKSGRKTYQHIMVNVVPGVVKLVHAALEPVHVLHHVPEAMGIHHRLPIYEENTIPLLRHVVHPLAHSFSIRTYAACPAREPMPWVYVRPCPARERSPISPCGRERTRLTCVYLLFLLVNSSHPVPSSTPGISNI
jgi:hypothetical protein